MLYSSEVELLKLAATEPGSLVVVPDVNGSESYLGLVVENGKGRWVYDFASGHLRTPSQNIPGLLALGACMLKYDPRNVRIREERTKGMLILGSNGPAFALPVKRFEERADLATLDGNIIDEDDWSFELSIQNYDVGIIRDGKFVTVASVG